MARPGPVRWRREKVTVAATQMGGIDVIVATPRGIRRTQPTPVLLVGDGPYYSRYAALSRIVAEAIEAGRIAPIRLALLEPGARFERYSANPRYSEALARHVLPTLARDWGASGTALLMGTSLGGLAALHAEWLTPGTFAGLFLQSGSFFLRGVSDDEAGAFEYFEQVADFMAQVHGARTRHTDARIVMTCGQEDNLACNRLLASALDASGHDVTLHEIPGGHTWPSWQGGLEDHLVPWLVRNLA